MSAPIPARPGRLITPLEPASACGPIANLQAAATGQQSTHAVLGRIEAAVASSRGCLHDANEDAHSVLRDPGRLFVVADGVGGGAMAQTASRQLVSHLHAALDACPPDADRTRAAMLDADRAIAHCIAQVTDSPGAATVALCAPVNASASKWLVAWVGDCRVYRLAVGGTSRLELLTRDDTFRHLGELPPSGGSLDDPARMVGNGATSGANVALHGLDCGDQLLLCSDGLHKYVDIEAGTRLLKRPVPLLQRCEELIALARTNGSSDDATVLLLLRRAGSGTPRLRWLARWFGSVDERGARS